MPEKHRLRPLLSSGRHADDVVLEIGVRWQVESAGSRYRLHPSRSRSSSTSGAVPGPGDSRFRTASMRTLQDVVNSGVLVRHGRTGSGHCAGSGSSRCSGRCRARQIGQ